MKSILLLAAAAAATCLSADEPACSFPVRAAIPAPKAPEGLAWVDETIARFAENYTVLLKGFEALPESKDQYPRSFVGGEYRLSKDWDWCSGFFQGTLWYLYEATGEAKWKAAAERYCETQAHIRFSNLHHDLGFMFVPSAWNGLRLTGEPRYAEWLYDAARTLQTRFRPTMRCIQSWGYWGKDWEEPAKRKSLVIVDNLLNLELWEWAGLNPATGELTPQRDWMAGEVYLEMAEMHADTTIGLIVRPDGSTYHVACCDPKTGRLVEHQNGQAIGHWSRGQGWAIYGFEMMYRYTGKASYLETAMKCADYALSAPNVPADRVPYWDYEAPEIPNEEVDDSAGAVIACGLIRLSRECPDAAKAKAYREEALTIAKSLSTPKHFAAPGELGGFAMRHFVGAKPAKSEVDVPMCYADYYYLELLMELKRPLKY